MPCGSSVADELTDKVGYCLAHIYRMERAGLFPASGPSRPLAPSGGSKTRSRAGCEERVDARDQAGAVTAKA